MAAVDHSLSRATIVAALIGLLGTVVAGFVGNRAGERKAGDEVQNLEVRMRLQETALQTLQAQLAERDSAIRTLTDQVARERARADSASQGSPSGVSTPSETREESTETRPIETASVEQDAPIAVKRLAPVDISLEKCEHWGGGLSCRMLFKNTGSAAANMALDNRSSFAYDEHGDEYYLEQAVLGSREWSARQFGAIRLEPGIVVAAKFRFGGVPDSARRGPLRLVLAVVEVAGPQAFLGPNPQWQAVVFKDVPFG